MTMRSEWRRATTGRFIVPLELDAEQKVVALAMRGFDTGIEPHHLSNPTDRLLLDIAVGLKLSGEDPNCLAVLECVRRNGFTDLLNLRGGEIYPIALDATLDFAPWLLDEGQIRFFSRQVLTAYRIRVARQRISSALERVDADELARLGELLAEVRA